jgi:DNA-binding NarL/FixJ family response regulator
MAEISVLVVDDQSLIRVAVTELIKHEDGISVLGEATNGREAVDAVRRLRPDIVLMDIRMPVMDGLDATREICADPDLALGSRILILTTFEQEDYVMEALRAGASGFIGKATEPAELMSAIRTIHAGDALLSPAATRALIDRYAGSRSASPEGRSSDAVDALTGRELEVLRLVAQGSSNEEIGRVLSISPHTAKTHVNRIMTKSSAHDRAQLVIIAYEAGIVTPGG